MQLTASELALIAGGFTVLGALIGSMVTYSFALRLASVNARREAGRRLREAFSPELAALNPITGSKSLDVENLLQSAWPRHHVAVSELSFQLCKAERASLERAWHEYYVVGGSIRFFDYYMGENPRKKFQERVHAILKHTQI